MNSQITERTEIKFAGDLGAVQCLGHFRESLDLLEPVLSAEIPHRGKDWIVNLHLHSEIVGLG